MIRFNTGFIRDCGVVLKLERFFLLIILIFWVGLSYWAWVSIIGDFIESWCVAGKGYLVPKRGFGVKTIQSVSRSRTSGFSRGGQ